MSKKLLARLRKTIASIVMITTIVWLSGIVALVPVASAATIVDGDVIRNPSAAGMAQFDVYIVKTVGTKKFKRLILNPAVFTSYGHLKASNVKLVTQAEMDAYTTSALVRVDGDTKVYALVPQDDVGMKSWVNVDSATFLAAGADADSVYTINSTDAGNYTATGDITTQAQVSTFLTAGTLPGGVILPTAGAVNVSLAASNPASATYVRDTDVTATAHAQANANFLALNFTAPSSGEVKVTTLKVTRSGISADSDLGTIYLYDGNTQLAQHSSFSSKIITFNNANGLFTVAAGATKTINVRADIATSNPAANVSSIVLGLSDATAVTSNASSVGGTFPINGNPMAVTTVADLGYANIATFTTFPATSDPGVTAKELWRFNVTANDQDMLIEKIKMTVVGTVATTDLANFSLEVSGGAAIGSPIAAMSASKELLFDLSASPYKILSGQTKTIVVKGDVVNGSGRAFKFTIRQVGDFIVRDNSYGVYVAPLVSGAAFTLVDADAAGDGTNINNGTLTVSLATDSPSGNVAPGATGVTLAKFTYKANGEDIKVNTIRVSVNEENADSAIDNGKLYFNGSQIGSTDTSVADETTVPVTTTQIIAAGTTATIEYRADMKSGGTSLASGQTIVVSLIAGTTDASGQSSLANVATSAVTGRTITVATGILTAAKNLTVSDATSALPTGVKSATGVKIGSFVLTAGAGEGASVSQIRLTDNVASTEAAGYAGTITALDLDAVATGKTMTVVSSDKFVVGETYRVSVTAGGTTTPATIVVRTKPLTTTFTYDVTSALVPVGGAGVTAMTIRNGLSTDVDTLADAFQNLRLMQGATQVGSTISNLTDGTGTNYDFTPSSAITIAKGTQVVFDILADIKSSALTFSVNSDADGVIIHTLTTATGLDTGNSANTATGVTQLQKVYVAGVGTLATSVASDSPISAQVVMGATGVELARFKFTETSASEALTLTQIIVTDTTGSVGSLSNIKLMDGTTPLATVATLTAAGLATFPSLSVTVPKGGNKVLSITADITPYPGGTSASTHLLSIANLGDITGTGASSGTTLAQSAVSTGTAGTATVYRTKLTIAHASDSPQGSSSGSNGQVVAKFVVSNSTNVGNYDATVKIMNLAVSSTISNAGDAAATTIKVYKTNTSNLLATATYAAAAAFADTAFADGDFVDVSIASGSNVTLIVTADTRNAANPKNFSAGIAANDVTWSDGTTEGATINAVDSLPITGKTLNY